MFDPPLGCYYCICLPCPSLRKKNPATASSMISTTTTIFCINQIIRGGISNSKNDRKNTCFCRLGAKATKHLKQLSQFKWTRHRQQLSGHWYFNLHYSSIIMQNKAKAAVKKLCTLLEKQCSIPSNYKDSQLLFHKRGIVRHWDMIFVLCIWQNTTYYPWLHKVCFWHDYFWCNYTAYPLCYYQSFFIFIFYIKSCKKFCN